MSFRSLPEKVQRALAREHIEEAKMNAQYDPHGDYSHIFGPPGMNEDQMVEWLRSQDDVAPISIMKGLVEKKSGQTIDKASRFKASETDGLVYDKKYDMDWIVLSNTLPETPGLSLFGSSTIAERDLISNELEGIVNTIRELGYGWRLPTYKELQSFWDDGIGYRNWGPFKNVHATAILSADSIGFSNFDPVLFCTDHDEIPCLQAFAVRPRCETKRLSIEKSWKSAMIAEEKRKQEESNNLLKGIVARKEWTPFLEGRFLKAPDTSIIYDTLTRFEWLVGPDRRTSYDEAESWIADIHDGWNMPSRGELMDLLNAGISKKDWGPFKVSGSFIWWGEYGSSEAWGFCFDASKVNKGEYGCREYLKSKKKSGGMRAFAVRNTH